MIAVRRVLVAGFATLLVAGACTSVTIPSIPPIVIPSIPPINIPTIPPINIPSGGPGFTIPPIAIPTGSVPCSLITGAEVGQIWGSAVTDSSDEATNCSFVSANFASISVQSTTDTDFTGVQFLMGSTLQQINVGGFAAVQGAVLGQPAIYVQKPTGQLQVLGILTGTDAATYTKLQQIATIAVGRMP